MVPRLLSCCTTPAPKTQAPAVALPPRNASIAAAAPQDNNRDYMYVMFVTGDSLPLCHHSFQYSVLLQPTTVNSATYMPRSNAPVMYSSSGCSPTACSWCVHTHNHSLVTPDALNSQMRWVDQISGYENSMVLLMRGAENASLDFGCTFQVWYVDPLSDSMLPSCSCDFHVVLSDAPGSSSWTRADCACLAPMHQWATLPSPPGFNVSMGDIVRHVV